MIEPPQAQTLILCDQVRVDPVAVRFSLEGIHLAIVQPTIPTPKISLTAYANLAGGRGQGVLELVWIWKKREREIYRKQLWRGFDAAMPRSHCVIDVRKIEFPWEGPYTFALSFDNEVIASTTIEVMRG